LRGIFYQHELKLVQKRHKLRISGFVNQYIQNKTLHYTVTLESLPSEIVVYITRTELKSFGLTQTALKELKNLQKYNTN
jgi:hypothetical protein